MTTPPPKLFRGMTPQDADWHNAFMRGTPTQQADMRLVLGCVVTALRSLGYTTAHDDRSEVLLAAITRYATESQQ